MRCPRGPQHLLLGSLLAVGMTACGTTVPLADQADPARQGGSALGQAPPPTTPSTGSTGEASAPSVKTPGQVTGPAPTSTVPTAGPTAAVAGPSRAASIPLVSGITKSEIKLGVYFVDGGAANAFSSATGTNVAIGDQRKQWNALADWFNRNGGMVGRKVSLVPYVYDIGKSSAANAQAMCSAWAEDAHVYAAVASMLMGAGAVPCLAKKKVISAQATFNVGTQDDFARYRPYYYAPGSIETITLSREYVNGLHEQGFFTKGAKVGLLAFDSPEYSRGIQAGLEPQLKKYGVTLADKRTVANGSTASDLAAITAAVSNAQLAFRSKGITHVMFLDSGGTLATYFMQDAQNQGSSYRYGLNSTSFPAFVEQQSGIAQQLAKTEVVGTFPGGDTNDLATAPANPGRTQCLSIFKAAGFTPVSPTDATWLLGMCSFMFFVRDSLAKAPSYDGTGFAAGVAALGSTTSTAAAGFADRFAADKAWGGTARGYLTFNQTCTCFRYRPGTTTFG